MIFFETIRNDGTKPTMKKLVDLKNIFARQLPKMPKEYIVRLVFDQKHESIIIKNESDKIFGGICYCIFPVSKMAEVVFLAISSDSQVKGFGTKLMNHLKTELQKRDIHFLMTCADNLATGYFKKQGFHKHILMDQNLWKGYLKDYEGSTLMECILEGAVDYNEIGQQIKEQRKMVFDYIKSIVSNKQKFEGIAEAKWKKLETKVKRNGNAPILPIEEAEGLATVNYTQAELSELAKLPEGTGFQNSCIKALDQLVNHRCAWPFMTPVDKEEVPDYYDVIKNPMDFQTIRENINKDLFRSKADFIRAVRQIFANAKIYNLKNTIYYKCALELEVFSEEVFVNLKERDEKEEAHKMEIEQGNSSSQGDSKSKNMKKRKIK